MCIKTFEGFWELEKQIRNDRRHPGVMTEVKKSRVISGIFRLIRLEVFFSEIGEIDLWD